MVTTREIGLPPPRGNVEGETVTEGSDALTDTVRGLPGSRFRLAVNVATLPGAVLSRFTLAGLTERTEGTTVCRGRIGLRK
jgi:hypothetical protein